MCNTVDTIVASAVEARKQLSKLEYRLQEKIDGIDFTAFKEKRPISKTEQKERQQLRFSQVQVRDAFTQLAFVTAQRLDNSFEVMRLNERMKAIKESVDDQIKYLKKIEDIAETVAKVSDTVADVVAKVAEKAADIIL